MVIEGAQVKQHIVKNSPSYEIERKSFRLLNRNQPMTLYQENSIVKYTIETRTWPF